jgi:hypothetical protein
MSNRIPAAGLDVAAAVLVSGNHRASADANAEEKSHFHADADQYNRRSAFPGILNIETPLLRSTQYPPRSSLRATR